MSAWGSDEDNKLIDAALEKLQRAGVSSEIANYSLRALGGSAKNSAELAGILTQAEMNALRPLANMGGIKVPGGTSLGSKIWNGELGLESNPLHRYMLDSEAMGPYGPKTTLQASLGIADDPRLKLPKYQEKPHVINRDNAGYINWLRNGQESKAGADVGKAAAVGGALGGMSFRKDPMAGLKENIGDIQGSIAEAIRKAQEAALGSYPTGDSSGSSYGESGTIPGSMVSMPDIPAPPSFSFKRNDFSKEADEMAAKAYNPQFAAIDQAQKNAQSSYSRSDQIVSGLYDQLVQDINTDKAATGTRYDQAATGAQGQAQGLAGAIGDTYDKAAAQEAAMMKKLGIEARAGDVFAGGTADQARQQSAALQSGRDSSDYYNQQKQGNMDYLGNLANAERTQGTVEREGLLNDLNNVLKDYDQQRLGLKGEQMQNAQDLGFKLSDNDLNLQQMNYGVTQDQYGNAMQQAQMQIGVDTTNAGLSQQQYAMEQAQRESNLRNQQDAWKMRYQMQQERAAGEAAAREAQIEQQRYDQEWDLKQAKHELDTASTGQQIEKSRWEMSQPGKGAQGGAGGGLEFGNADPVTQVVTQIANVDPVNAKKIYGLIQEATKSPYIRNMSLPDFMQAVKNTAQANGLNPMAVEAGAASYWNEFLRKPGG